VLTLDRYIRNVNLRDIGIMNAQNMDPQTRSYVESYVQGINDYAKSIKIWPIEFYLFWTSWENFTPAHVNSMMALFSLTLEFDWMFEIAR
jgi:acyl-homoserine lactone acylase PvdQ